MAGEFFNLEKLSSFQLVNQCDMISGLTRSEVHKTKWSNDIQHFWPHHPNILCNLIPINWNCDTTRHLYKDFSKSYLKSWRKKTWLVTEERGSLST